ncbi:MAG: hypothetical protein IH989_04460 [Planctomycetes bacterium]|nr:hypothetical protein [Planctomycetota bacterium]
MYAPNRNALANADTLEQYAGTVYGAAGLRRADPASQDDSGRHNPPYLNHRILRHSLGEITLDRNREAV